MKEEQSWKRERRTIIGRQASKAEGGGINFFPIPVPIVFSSTKFFRYRFQYFSSSSASTVRSGANAVKLGHWSTSWMTNRLLNISSPLVKKFHRSFTFSFFLHFWRWTCWTVLTKKKAEAEEARMPSLKNPKIFSAIAMAMSIYRTLCVIPSVTAGPQSV